MPPATSPPAPLGLPPLLGAQSLRMAASPPLDFSTRHVCTHVPGSFLSSAVRTAESSLMTFMSLTPIFSRSCMPRPLRSRGRPRAHTVTCVGAILCCSVAYTSPASLNILFKLSLSEVTMLNGVVSIGLMVCMHLKNKDRHWATGSVAPIFALCSSLQREGCLSSRERKGRKLSNTMFSSILSAAPGRGAAVSWSPIHGSSCWERLQMFLLETTATPGIVHLLFWGHV